MCEAIAPHLFEALYKPRRPPFNPQSASMLNCGHVVLSGAQRTTADGNRRPGFGDCLDYWVALGKSLNSGWHTVKCSMNTDQIYK